MFLPIRILNLAFVYSILWDRMLWDAMLGEVYAMVHNTVISPTILDNPWFYNILINKSCNQLLHISINKECQVSTKNTDPALSLLLLIL